MCQYVRLAVEIQRGNPAGVCDVAGASEALPPGSDKQATNMLDINEDLFPPTVRIPHKHGYSLAFWAAVLLPTCRHASPVYQFPCRVKSNMR